MGESKLKLPKREEMLMPFQSHLECAGIQTMTGRVQVRWETERVDQNGFVDSR